MLKLNQYLRTPVFTLLLIVSGMVLVGCGNQDSDPASESTAVRPVKLITVEGAGNATELRFPAIIGAAQRTQLSFQVGGLISELPIAMAQIVEQGDAIARLDPRDFESAVSAARASFANAEEEYQRAVRLAEQDAIARSVLDQRKTQRDVARAQLESAEKALEDSVLRAPFSGSIASVPVRAQQTVAPGTVIATLINVSELEASINLPASIVARVPANNERSDRAATVFLDAAPEQAIQAQFKEADLVADATSQTYEVTFSFSSPEELLVLPGMNASVVLSSADFGSPGMMPVVPLAAIQSDGSEQYVWLFDDQTNTVSRQSIIVQPGIGNTMQILQGLEEGDQIVGAGGAYLTEGLKVRPWSE